MSPRTEKLLHSALTDWRNWQAGNVVLDEEPTVLEQLQGGLTNESFLIGSGAFRAVIRVNAANTQSLGIDRDRERALLKYLQPTHSVPKLIYSDSSVQVTQLIRGRHLSRLDLADARVQNTLESRIQRIQAISVNMPTRNYADYIRLYSDQLTYFEGLYDIQHAANMIDQAQWTPVIAHHDLILENLIINEQDIYFLDWEYADLGHPLIDHIKLFGRKYCEERYPSPDIDALVTLQTGIVKLWYAVQDEWLKHNKLNGNS